MSDSAAAQAVPRKSYNHPCLIAQALDVLGDRWTLLILRDLMSGLQRYGDIFENCGGLSPNLLSARLKRLEADGLVERHYFKGLPPRVEYTLTEKGWAVRPVLLSLIEWSKNWTDAELEPESIGDQFTADFAVRVLPTFSFDPERARNLAATMTVELSDCTDESGSCWSFDVHDGQLHPRRDTTVGADVHLVTDTAGFFRFVRCEATPADCGELSGDIAAALAIQSCFQSG
jgi:DNA-binding HxlR family transcriptional regulator